MSIHSIDPMMDGSLGCWDNGLMGDQWNARFISRVHIMPFISNYEVFYPQGGQEAILTKQYCSGPRRRLPWRDLPSHEATRHAAGGRWWQCEGFQWELIWFLFPGYTISFKPSFRICIKPPPPCPPSHNMWKNIEMQNQPLSKLVKLGECYQLVPECSESQSEYSS